MNLAEPRPGLALVDLEPDRVCTIVAVIRISASFAGWALHRDLDPLPDADRPPLAPVLTAPWIAKDQEERAVALVLKVMRLVQNGTPVILGGALVVLAGLIGKLRGEGPALTAADTLARQNIERLALEAVMAAERARGNDVVNVSADKCGWDVTSYPPVVSGAQSNLRQIRRTNSCWLSSSDAKMIQRVVRTTCNVLSTASQAGASPRGTSRSRPWVSARSENVNVR